MEKLIEFWALHGSTITNFLLVTGGTFVTFIISRILKKSTNKMLNYFLGVTTQLFGGVSNMEDIRNNVEQLPFVKDFKEFVKDKNIEDEVRLVRLTRLLKNPKLTDDERLDYQYEHDVLIDRIGNKLTTNTKLVLEKLQETQKEV